MQGHYELRHESYTSYLKSSDVDSMDTFRVQTENTNHNIILSTLYVALVILIF
jgi:Trk K+ transport system NAD-binding subunit